MSSRARRILNMALPETNISTQPGKKKPDKDLPVLNDITNSHIHLQEYICQSFSSEHSPTDIHNDSFGTNSIPDSTIGLDLDISFGDSNEKYPDCHKKLNKVVIEETSSDSDNSCSRLENDSLKSTPYSTEDAFSSDDSVNDPDFQMSSIESDSDTESNQTYDYSPKPGTSGTCNMRSLSLGEMNMEALSSQKQAFNIANHLAGFNIQPANVHNELNNIDTQPAGVDIQPASIDTQPASVDTQPASIDTQPASVDTQPASISTQRTSVDTQPPSIDTQPASLDTQPPSIDTQPPSVDTQPPSIDTQPPSNDTQPASVDTIDSDYQQERSRKRKANPELWKKNLTKVLRNSGKAYISLSKSKKFIDARKLGPVCSEKCKLKCSTMFKDEERVSIFEEFWATADLHIQRQFVHEHMTKISPKYQYIRDGSNRKNPNHAYHLPQNNIRLRVCKVFFMHTLAISDKFIRTVIKKHSNLIGSQTKDNRGKHVAHNKTDTHLTDGIKAHINSIPRIESHYCRAQTKREYIEGGTNVATLHRDYIQKCKSEGKDYASYQIYYNIFKKEFNISFWQPKKDQCEDCVAYANAEDKESLQIKYDLHLTEKSLARAEKEKDKENVSDTFIVAVYDLQAVLPCPRGEVSSFYYVSKINLLNFTITELETKNTICFVWHEGEGARGVNELGSCVYMYLKNLHDNANEAFDVVFYSDNCCGQQKNKFMLAMYQHAIREFSKLRSVTHKYLIKGHTQNEGDSAHSVIGRNISNALKSSPIYVPDQYITLIKTAKKKGKPYSVRELTHDSFFDLKPLAAGNYTITEDGEKLRWTDIKVLKINQDNPYKFFFKTSYDDRDFKSVATLPKRQAKSTTVATTTLKKLYAQKLKVPESKTRGILKLIEKNVIPKYYEAFYANL